MSHSHEPGCLKTHVFISYAREDQDVAATVASALRNAGIRPWIDCDLEPGTPNWDRAIRDAIESSFAVVFIASGATVDSDYVGTELLYGRENRLEVIPVWVEGTTWGRCVPGLQWLQTQYIDARGVNRESGFARLVERLTQLVRDSTLGHFLVRGFRVRAEREHGDLAWTQETRKPLPPGCCSIELDDPERNGGATGDAIVVNCFAWRSMGKLSDEVYSTYLADRLPPYTYGRSWVLARVFRYGRRLALPWPWLLSQGLDKGRSVWTEESDCTLGDVGMVPGSRWVISKPERKGVFGLLVQHCRVLDALLENPKVTLYGFDLRKTLKAFRADEVEPGRFLVAAVASSSWRILERIEASTCGGDFKERDVPWVIVQTEKLADSDVGHISDSILRRRPDTGIGGRGWTDTMAIEDLT